MDVLCHLPWIILLFPILSWSHCHVLSHLGALVLNDDETELANE